MLDLVLIRRLGFARLFLPKKMIGTAVFCLIHRLTYCYSAAVVWSTGCFFIVIILTSSAHLEEEGRWKRKSVVVWVGLLNNLVSSEVGE